MSGRVAFALVQQARCCHVIASSGSTYLFGDCDPKNPTGLVDITFNNTFYTDSGDVTIKCGSETWTLSEYQQKGFETGSKVLPPPTTDEVFGWVTDLLDFKA